MFKFVSPRTRRLLVWLTPAILVAIVGASLAIISAYRTDQSIRDSLTDRVKTVASALNGNNLPRLFGSSADLTDSYYLSLKSQLIDIRSINSDIRFVYIFGLRDDKVFFYGDSEPSYSADYSPPGQVYTEASPALLRSFRDGNAFVEGPLSDRWGTWLSALAPIYAVDSFGARSIAGVVGMDISNSDRQKQIFSSVAIYAGATLILELLLLTLYFYFRHASIVKAVAIEKNIRERQYDFISMMSHQLRAPIANARAVIGLLKDKKGYESLDEAYNQIVHLSNIVSTLLFFIENKSILSKERIISKQTTNLVSIVYKQLDFLKKEIDAKKIAVEVQLPEKIMLPIDEILLNRVVYSVLENAVTYNREFGKINISMATDEKKLVLSVSDTGFGIPAKEQEKVLTPFYRASNATLGANVGSGLSLFIVNEILRLFGGEVTFRSKEERGSTFYLHF